MRGKTIRTTVDAVGKYSINVKPGTYYVLIISENRRGEGQTEIDGQKFIRQITVKENEVVDISNKFGLI